MRAVEGSASVVAKVNNNTVSAPLGTGTNNGIRIESGAASAINTNVCLEMTGNISAGENGAPGMGLFKQGIASGTHNFGVEGLTPSPSTLASQVTSLVNGNNASGGTTTLLSGQTGFQSCTVP